MELSLEMLANLFVQLTLYSRLALELVLSLLVKLYMPIPQLVDVKVIISVILPFI